MIIRNADDVTVDALAVMSRAMDPRLREIMISQVTHLHTFVRDVRLTESELRDATAILDEIGKQTTDTRHEAVLMAGSRGVSSHDRETQYWLTSSGMQTAFKTTEPDVGRILDDALFNDGASIRAIRRWRSRDPPGHTDVRRVGATLSKNGIIEESNVSAATWVPE